MIFNHKKYIAILVVFLTTSIAYCQSVKAQKKFSNINNISVRTSLHTFFDNGKIFYYDKTYKAWSPLSFGITYNRKITSEKYFGLSADLYYFETNKGVLELKPGNYTERSYLLVSGYYYKQFYRGKRSQSLVFGNANIRLGYETVHAGHNVNIHPDFIWYESFSISKNLIDFGLSIGVKHQYYFGNRSDLSLELKYTAYPYTFDKKNPVYSWDKGPTWQTLTFSIGYGINWGKERPNK